MKTARRRTRTLGGVGRAVSHDDPYPIYASHDLEHSFATELISKTTQEQ
jgi:hypothetical protein